MIKIPRPGLIRRQISTGNKVRNVQWSTEEIIGVLNHYDFSHFKIEKIMHGGNSDNISLLTSCGKKVLKRYMWSLQSTLHEHSVVMHSMEHNFPCASLVLNKDKLSYTEFGDRHYAIYDFIEGYCYADFFIRPKSRQRMVAFAGQKLADFHQLMTGFVPQGKKLNGFMPGGKSMWRDTAWHLEVLDTYLQLARQKSNPSEPEAYLLDIADDLARAFIGTDQYYKEPEVLMPRVVIHGDYQPRNLLFDRDGITGVLDFGDANLNLRVVDVVRGLTTFCRDKKNLINVRCAEHFLGAYQNKQKLSEREIAAIPDLMLSRNLRNIIWSLHREINNFKNQRPLNYRLMKLRGQWDEARRIRRYSADLQKTLLSLSAG